MTHSPTPVRRVLRAAALAAAVVWVSLLATPALAVPEGWSDPEPVDKTHALLIYVIAPLACVAVIALLTSLPHLVSDARATPSVLDADPTTPALAARQTRLDELLGGPADGAELEAADADGSTEK